MSNEEPVIKGMEGIKSDRPEFIQTTFQRNGRRHSKRYKSNSKT